MSAPVAEKYTCVVHVDNRFVQLRRDYFELFEGDECCARLVWLFEFQTDNEMSRRRLAGEPGDPWLTLSVDKIQTELLETYKERAILARLAFLKANRIIQVDARGGRDQINRYLFNGERVSHLLEKRKRLPFNLEYNRNTRGAEEPLDAPSAPGAPGAAPAPLDALGASGGAPHIKEEEVILNIKEPIPPTPSPKNQNQNPTPTPPALLDLEDDAVTFTQNAYSRTNPRAKLDNLRARSGEEVCGLIRAAEKEWGTCFRAALIAYLSDRSDWHRENRWPIKGFLKQIYKYIPQCPPGGVVAETVSTVQPETRPLDGLVIETPCVAAAPAPPTIPFAAAEWNRVVTAGPPVEQWTHRDRPMDKAVADSEFIASLEKVLPVCQKAFEVQPDEVGWLSFRWLLRKGKTDVENWYAIASGDMNWLRARRGAKPKRPTIIEEVTRRNNAILAEHERQRVAATERTRSQSPAVADAPVGHGPGLP